MFAFLREYIGDYIREIPFFQQEAIAGMMKMIQSSEDVEKMPVRDQSRLDSSMMMIGSVIALHEQLGLR